MSGEEPKINCPTFRTHEFIAKDITEKINKVNGVREKAIFAEELQKEANALLSCPDYKKEESDCENCHLVANLRNKTAELLIKAKKLA